MLRPEDCAPFRLARDVPFTLLPLSPGALARLDAAVIAEGVEMTGYFASTPLQHGVIDGIEVVAGVPDPSLPGLVSAEPAPSALPPGSICETCFDAPAIQLLPAPWGGEMGVCPACAMGTTASGVQPFVVTASQDGVVIVAQPLDPDTWE